MVHNFTYKRGNHRILFTNFHKGKKIENNIGSLAENRADRRKMIM
jgi:hypothetical protein